MNFNEVEASARNILSKRFTFGLIIELQSYFLVINPSFQHQFKRTRLRKPQIGKA